MGTCFKPTRSSPSGVSFRGLWRNYRYIVPPPTNKRLTSWILLDPLFSRLENPKLDQPTKPNFSEDNDIKNIEEEIYKEEIKVYVRAKMSLKSTLH